MRRSKKIIYPCYRGGFGSRGGGQEEIKHVHLSSTFLMGFLMGKLSFFW